MVIMEQLIPKDKFTRVYLALWGVCIFIGLTAFVFYKIGFRLTGNFSPVKVGEIELSSNQSGLQIILDNREKSVMPKEGLYRITSVSPGLHSLMVSKPDFWPWIKTFEVPANASRPVFAFLFPMDGLPTKVVSPSDPAYEDGLNKIRLNVVPEPKEGYLPYSETESFVSWLSENIPNRKISNDGSTALFVEDNSIYVAWISESEPPPHYFCQENPCKLKFPVTVSVEPIKSVGFFKDRSDVVIFAAGSALYAIEVDREGTQNFQPFYKGDDPYFYESPEGTLYIKDGDSLLKATL